MHLRSWMCLTPKHEHLQFCFCVAVHTEPCREYQIWLYAGGARNTILDFRENCRTRLWPVPYLGFCRKVLRNAWHSKNVLKKGSAEPQMFCRTLGVKPSFSGLQSSSPIFSYSRDSGDFVICSIESPVSSYRAHRCAMGFDGPPPDGFSPWQWVRVHCSPISPPWRRPPPPPLFVPWVTMGGPTHLWVGPPISPAH